ncbi:SCO3374 family protein [Streptomyces fulvoviolaceus]|uniref:SCO3374 family protein n=1 Tax=Streptomyces fulvoviolaceus TaxID=285535 RepID=UPI0005B8E5C7|nr:SCO3374 family protein [Streptomyces fulvoviolaceus]MCT9081988.1 SCO3374 family protein [Streptomyces fulvoviolaceus]
MVGSLPPVTRPPLATDLTTVPLPRRPLEASDPADPADSGDSGESVRRWYENELGWATVPAQPGRLDIPVRLRVGLRFDVLDVPAEAGRAALRHLAPGSPVAVEGDRMRLLMAAGGAEELPGVLDWLEWGALALDLLAIGEGGLMDAPLPPGRQGTLQGAAVWLRPPEPGCEVEASLPTVSAVGGGGGAPDLVRVLNTVATHCHRLRLRRACAQP